MPKANYRIVPLSDDVFELYEFDKLLTKFTRSTFRKDLESIGRGNNWIGSILRLFLKKYPSNHVCPIQQRSECDRIGADRLLAYLRSKGFRVFKNLQVSDKQIIEHLELKGFLIEGLLNDNFYRSPLLQYHEAMKRVSN